MNLEVIADGASRFAASVEKLTKMIGPADRARPLRDCCAGLLVMAVPAMERHGPIKT